MSVDRLLLSTHRSSLNRAGVEGLEISLPEIYLRFVWGPLPSPNKLEHFLAARSKCHGRGDHWSDFVDWRTYPRRDRKSLALREFCEAFDSIELWFDPEPNDQLLLIWLLDYFRPYPEIVSKLGLRLIDFELLSMPPADPDDDPVDAPNFDRDVANFDIRPDEIEIASRCWQAYRAVTPQACFDLLQTDLSFFPWLKSAIADLLAELPSSTTGLGATEMRLLELISGDCLHTYGLLNRRDFFAKRVFNSIEMAALLEKLADGPRPAVLGLDEALRTLERERLERKRDRFEAFHRRAAAFYQCELSLTDFGQAVLAHKEDFSRHNPIDRWWGGTHLTNDNLWRWTPTLSTP